MNNLPPSLCVQEAQEAKVSRIPAVTPQASASELPESGLYLYITLANLSFGYIALSQDLVCRFPYAWSPCAEIKEKLLLASTILRLCHM